MAHTKAGGTAKNLTDSKPKFLGIKLYAGEKARIWAIIVRQRGTRILPGKIVGVGTDHTLFALKDGIVSYTQKRKQNFNSRTVIKKIANVIAK